MRLFLEKKAQGLIEYVVLVAFVVGALVAMSTYLRRSIQALIKFSVDEIQGERQPGAIVLDPQEQKWRQELYTDAPASVDTAEGTITTDGKIEVFKLNVIKRAGTVGVAGLATFSAPEEEE